jgi:ligand-binding sensor domain-containing protein
VWAATQDGLARLGADGKWQGYNTSGGLQADRVRRLYSDDGQRLWLGFVQGGAARVKTN